MNARAFEDKPQSLCRTRLCATPLNPVTAGLVRRAEDWPWSSVRDYSGTLAAAPNPNRILTTDRILLPADERTRI